MLEVDDHPLLDLAVLAAVFPAPLAQTESPAWLTELLQPTATAPFSPGDELRRAVRDMLRHGGFKPTGRSKPASEYLLKAAAAGLPTINAAVDAANATSLHSGLPISVVDLDRATEPLRVAVAATDARYAFNTAGQEIDVGGLLCLHDAAGPCANAVKDAQRTKTGADTRRILCLIWGTRFDPPRTAAAQAWLRDLLLRAGAAVE